MKAAVVLAPGRDPTYADFSEPVAGAGELVLTVTASALTRFTKARAAGKHFSFAEPPPFVAGIDGIGRLADGRRVYFLFPRSPHGGMAQATVVPSSRCFAVPDGVDDVTLAAVADPAMSSWVALELRAKLAPGETVLVNGATGSAGRVAVQVARHLGAGKILATGRDEEALRSLAALGVDEVIALTGEGKARSALAPWFERGVDVVLDYLWGPSAEQLLAASSAAPRGTALRFVQIGTASAAAITLPGTTLRASAVQIMGSGIGSVSEGELMGVMAKIMRAAPQARFAVPTRNVPLDRVEEVWPRAEMTPRVVVTMAAEAPSGSPASPA